MAKSPVGGSRAYLKGRIGSDVYSLGKDGKGKRQQVVRALAEEVANPRTSSQMFNRMIMSTVMQAVSAMAPIIDHSFDGVAKGQPSISEFIRRNYALVKTDAVAHPASGNDFGLNLYQEKGIQCGAYVVSDGAVQKNAHINASSGKLIISIGGATYTVGALKSVLGLSADGYITGCFIDKTNGFIFGRVQLTTTLADETEITAGNVASLFTVEGNVAITVSYADGNITFTLAGVGNDYAYGYIISEKVDGAWKHSACTLNNIADEVTPADTALPTYPVGTAKFLNGGDI